MALFPAAALDLTVWSKAVASKIQAALLRASRRGGFFAQAKKASPKATANFILPLREVADP